MATVMLSASNVYNLVEWFWVTVGTDPSHGNRFYHTKTQTIEIWPVLPPKPRYFNLTTLALIKNLSSDHIVTCSICKLCSFSRCFTSRFQICDPTNILAVPIENWRNSLKIGPYFTATQRISVGLQIWMLEVEVLAKLHNSRTHHVMIQSELKNLIAAKAGGNLKLQPQSGSNPAKHPRF